MRRNRWFAAALGAALVVAGAGPCRGRAVGRCPCRGQEGGQGRARHQPGHAQVPPGRDQEVQGQVRHRRGAPLHARLGVDRGGQAGVQREPSVHGRAAVGQQRDHQALPQGMPAGDEVQPVAVLGDRRQELARRRAQVERPRAQVHAPVDRVRERVRHLQHHEAQGRGNQFRQASSGAQAQGQDRQLRSRGAAAPARGPRPSSWPCSETST